VSLIGCFCVRTCNPRTSSHSTGFRLTPVAACNHRRSMSGPSETTKDHQIAYEVRPNTGCATILRQFIFRSGVSANEALLPQQKNRQIWTKLG
jgi:hypothetical protein